MNRVTAMLLECSKDTNTPVILSILYKLAITAGYTQSSVECLFSALTRIDSSQRRRQLIYRKQSLACVHFENKVTKELRIDEFITAWKKKPRALSF